VHDPAGDGHLTLRPDGLPMPVASNLNYVQGQTVPNLVVASLGGGALTVGSVAASHLIVDVVGYVTG